MAELIEMGDDGGGHWLVRMEWRPAGWSVCLPLLVCPCTIKSRSSLLALAHPGRPGKRAVRRLWCGGDRDALEWVQIPMQKGNFKGGRGAHCNCNTLGVFAVSCANWLNLLRCYSGCVLWWAQGSIIRWRCTLAPPGEYD